MPAQCGAKWRLLRLSSGAAGRSGRRLSGVPGPPTQSATARGAPGNVSGESLSVGVALRRAVRRVVRHLYLSPAGRTAVVATAGRVGRLLVAARGHAQPPARAAASIGASQARGVLLRQPLSTARSPATERLVARAELRCAAEGRAFVTRQRRASCASRAASSRRGLSCSSTMKTSQNRAISRPCNPLAAQHATSTSSSRCALGASSSNE